MEKSLLSAMESRLQQGRMSLRMPLAGPDGPASVVPVSAQGCYLQPLYRRLNACYQRQAVYIHHLERMQAEDSCPLNQKA